MFAKCANPNCSTRFEYHLGRRFYRFDQNERGQLGERNTHAVVHFWLCPRCAEVYALDFDGAHSLLVQPLECKGWEDRVRGRGNQDEDKWRWSSDEADTVELAGRGRR